MALTEEQYLALQVGGALRRNDDVLGSVATKTFNESNGTTKVTVSWDGQEPVPLLREHLPDVSLEES